MTLYIFDLDGTLISSYMDDPNKRYNSWRILPGRIEQLAELVAAGDDIAIATNQGGVAFGHVSEQAAMRKIAAVLEALSLPPDTAVAVCFAHPQSRIHRYRTPEALARRKPRGTMLCELTAAAGDPDHVVYIGDSQDDREAARDAKVSFRWASEFFKDESVDSM